MTDPSMHRPVLSIRRERLVREMAADLVQCGAVSPRSDAFRALLHSGKYETVDIVVCLEGAMQVGAQEQVAKEMTT